MSISDDNAEASVLLLPELLRVVLPDSVYVQSNSYSRALCE